MPATDRTHDRALDSSPSVAEIAALTRRLRELSTAGRHADPAARAAFLADKQALLARIEHAHTDPGHVARPTSAYGDVTDDGLTDDGAHVDGDAGWSR
ncbi:MAG: hypothetical protein ACRDRK_22870 [Pseudonocardia sp.]